MKQRAAEEALSAAYRQLRGGLLATIRRQVNYTQIAEDLLHDVFAKAVRAMREGRAPRNLVGCLHQVVRTTVVDHYRAQRPDVESLAHDPIAQAPDGEVFQALATCLQPPATTPLGPPVPPRGPVGIGILIRVR